MWDPVSITLILSFKKIIFNFWGERGKWRRKRIEVIDWLSLACPQLGTWLVTQACALTGFWTGNFLILRLMLNPLSHIRQGSHSFRWVFLSPLVVSSNAWDSSLLNTWGRFSANFYSSFSLHLSPLQFSDLWTPAFFISIRLPAPSSRLRESTRLTFPVSPCGSSLCALYKVILRLTSFISCISGSILLCYLISSVLKTILTYILFISVVPTLFGLEVEF